MAVFSIVGRCTAMVKNPMQVVSNVPNAIRMVKWWHISGPCCSFRGNGLQGELGSCPRLELAEGVSLAG